MSVTNLESDPHNKKMSDNTCKQPKVSIFTHTNPDSLYPYIPSITLRGGVRLISTIEHSVSFSSVSLSRKAGGSFTTLPEPELNSTNESITQQGKGWSREVLEVRKWWR